MIRSRSSSRQLVITVMAVTLVYAVAVVAAYEWVLRSVLENQLSDRQDQIAELVSDTIDGVFSDLLKTNHLISSNPAVVEFMVAPLDSRSDAELFSLAQEVLDVFGRVIGTSVDLEPYVILLSRQGHTFPSWEHGGSPFTTLKNDLHPPVQTGSGWTESVEYYRLVDRQKELGLYEPGQVLFFRRIVATTSGTVAGTVLTGIDTALIERKALTQDLEFQPNVSLLYRGTPVLNWNAPDSTLVVTTEELTVPGWSVQLGVSDEIFSEQMHLLRPATLPILLVSIVVTIAIVFVLLQHLLKNLKVVESVAAEITAGNLDVRVRDKPDWPGGMIGQAMDQSLDSIQNLMAERDQYYEQLRQEELTALALQIRPHFLLNSLETIRMAALVGGDQEVAQATEVLSRILDQAVRAQGGHISLEQELELCRDQVTLLELRRQRSIEFFVEINEELLNVSIPSFLLQPLVENAVRHGFGGDVGGGTIEVTGKIDNRLLRLSVRDDGVGMPFEGTRRGDPATWYNDGYTRSGLRNVFKRVQLTWGPEATLWAVSSPGDGSTVTVEIPKDRVVFA